MKKLLVLVICLLMTISIYAQVSIHAQGSVPAQKHLTFKGVPINGTLKAYTDAMIKAGFHYEGKTDNEINILSGDFAGFKSCYICVSTLSNCDVVNSISVLFPNRDTWSSVVSDYEQLKSMLTQKYGIPSVCSEKFTSHVGDNNTMKMYALRNEECEWYTIFSTELGDIELSVIEGTSYNTGAVRLTYYDKINSDKVQNAAMDDL